MATHIKVLGILHIIFGVLGVIIGLGVFALFGGIAGFAAAQDADAWPAVPILGAIGGLVLIIMLVLSVPGLILGYGLLNFRPWARTLGIVLSGLQLLHVPFGTLLGIYGLWVLLSPEGTTALEHGLPPIPAQPPYMK